MDLPAEYFLLLPLNGHRRLFDEFGAADCPAASRSSSIFLRAFHPHDAAMMERFVQTDSWRMMQILHANFRELAPSDPRKLGTFKSSSSAIQQLEIASAPGEQHGSYVAPTTSLLDEKA